MKPSSKPKQNFIKLFSYMSSLLDVEKMVEEHGQASLKVYNSAMQHYEEFYGKKDYVNLESEDLKFLDLIKSQSKTTKEISEEMGITQQKVAALSTKLIQKGLIYSYISKIEKKKLTFYKITPYGITRFLEENDI